MLAIAINNSKIDRLMINEENKVYGEYPAVHVDVEKVFRA